MAVDQPPRLQSVSRSFRKPQSNGSPLVWGVWPAMTLFPEQWGRNCSGSTNCHWRVVLHRSAIGSFGSYEAWTKMNCRGDRLRCGGRVGGESAAFGDRRRAGEEMGREHGDRV